MSTEATTYFDQLDTLFADIPTATTPATPNTYVAPAKPTVPADYTDRPFTMDVEAARTELATAETIAYNLESEWEAMEPADRRAFEWEHQRAVADAEEYIEWCQWQLDVAETAYYLQPAA